MRPRLIAVDDDKTVLVVEGPSRLQGGHGGSPWMTCGIAARGLLDQALQGGHGGSPWMTHVADLLAPLHLLASMRPRLIAVDDAGRVADVLAMGALQGGHGGSPWMTGYQGQERRYLTALQGGHGGSPWMTKRFAGCSSCGRSFNEATADRRGGRGGRARRRGSWRRFNEATADRRGGLVEVDHRLAALGASMRPRLIAVDDRSRSAKKARAGRCFNEATADRRGGRDSKARHGRHDWASMRPRLIAVDDLLRTELMQMMRTLQGGHGGSPWMTRRGVRSPTASASFNEATADRRGGRPLSCSRRLILSRLQGGHGGSPWMTFRQSGSGELRRQASMRPRLIAVDDFTATTWTRPARRLQGGHGGSPWMTGFDGYYVRDVFGLQGGHGGSPWMTRGRASSKSPPTPLQGGHGGSPWMTITTFDTSGWRSVLQGGHGGSPWMTGRFAHPVAAATSFNEATADRRGGPVVMHQ